MNLVTHHYIPIPLVIAGPPAVGKTFLANSLSKKAHCQQLLLVTNKPHQSNHEYTYLSTQEFLQKQQAKEFILSYMYAGYYFGIQKNSIESIQYKNKTPIIEIYTPKIIHLLKIYSTLHSVFLLPDNLTLLENHMKAKGIPLENQATLLDESLRQIEQFNDYFRYLYNECYILTENNSDEVIKDIIKRYIVRY